MTPALLSEVRGILVDARPHLRAGASLYDELEVSEPSRCTAHLGVQARELMGRIDGVLGRWPASEGEEAA